ncbi:hypothetical protein L917_20564 [Phytophthora nicotianae]|uniref:Uncharacterized protein n=1 Tax=Phytophthora nicotianae TaxID=4792 RepID=W2K2L0_PHYNI|nr:hypothetical protein L917_20564 [Phytophthora nicotianae]
MPRSEKLKIQEIIKKYPDDFDGKAAVGVSVDSDASGSGKSDTEEVGTDKVYSWTVTLAK